MSTIGGLTSGTEFLRASAIAYFESLYQRPPIKIGEELDRSLAWKPSLQMRVSEHLTVLAEVSETPYPVIFRLRRADIAQLQLPVSIYCVCPEEAYLGGQGEAKELMSHGYGLLTVSADGIVQRRCSTTPIIQQIPEADFRTEIAGLPPKLKRRLAESFNLYCANAPAGVADITEVIEGFVLRAGHDAVSKGWLKKADVRPGATAATLNSLAKCEKCKNASAAIGGAQSYVSRYRNTAHHFPKNRQQAYLKYRDCRHAFLEGLKEVQHFRTAVRNLGLSGNI